MSGEPEPDAQLVSADLTSLVLRETSYVAATMEQVTLSMAVIDNVEDTASFADNIMQANAFMIDVMVGFQAMHDITATVSQYQANADPTADVQTATQNAETLLNLCGQWRTIMLKIMSAIQGLGTILLGGSTATPAEVTASLNATLDGLALASISLTTGAMKLAIPESLQAEVVA